MLLGHRPLVFIDTDIAVIMGSDVSASIYICMSDPHAVEQRDHFLPSVHRSLLTYGQ